MGLHKQLDSIETLARDLLVGLKGRHGKRFLLGITGPPGAGKSTVSAALHDALSNENLKSCVVPMDGFHLDEETLGRMGIGHLKGVPESFDAEAFVELVKQLRSTTDQPVAYPTFDRSIECTIPGGGIVPVATSLVIVEGNYLLMDSPPWHQLRCLFDEVWYVDEPQEVLVPRLMERHMNGGKSSSEARKKVDSTDLPNAEKIASTKQLADKLVWLKHL